jgi:hypothetical protein
MMTGSNSGHIWMESASVEQQRMDRRLVTAAAQSAERLQRVCADWPPERVRELAFATALSRLKFELNRESYESLRSRYNARRTHFLTRLRDETA